MLYGLYKRTPLLKLYIYIVWLHNHVCRFNMMCSIRPLLLDCPSKEVRTAFYNILGTTIHNYYSHKLHIKVS